MTLANDIISRKVPDFDHYLREGETLDDIDEYGFTPLIEAAITCQPKIAEMLLARGAKVDVPDVTGRTALHWAVDHGDLEMTGLLLKSGANPNAYSRAGLSVLVYPVLRGQDPFKRLLYQYGGKLDFALDFIYAKLIGHRFELQGDVDIVNAEGEFIELDYEGFILEFSVAVVTDSLRRFTSSYSTRHLRAFFPRLHNIMDGFVVAEKLLQLQQHRLLTDESRKTYGELLKAPMLVLPAASRGHAMCFIRYGEWWAKIDRGENSLKEGSINLYRISKPERFDVQFLIDFIYKKQPRKFFHQQVNEYLGLIPVGKVPMTSQISGNCSWANVQAVLPAAYVLEQLAHKEPINTEEALNLYDDWIEWDKERALDESIQRFYLLDAARKATYASMLGAVFFQTCDHGNELHTHRVEKILNILMLPQYYYVLKSYLEIYCIRQLTRKGNNLLKLLEDNGINPNIGVNPVATGLKPRKKR